MIHVAWSNSGLPRARSAHWKLAMSAKNTKNLLFHHVIVIESNSGSGQLFRVSKLLSASLVKMLFSYYPGSLNTVVKSFENISEMVKAPREQCNHIRSWPSTWEWSTAALSAMKFHFRQNTRMDVGLFPFKPAKIPLGSAGSSTS